MWFDLALALLALLPFVAGKLAPARNSALTQG